MFRTCHKFRKRAVEYRKESNTLEKTAQTFKIGVSTLREWERRYKESGEIKNKPINRPHKKIPPKDLELFVETHPDAYLEEIAKSFNCTEAAIRKALKRLKITRKKTKRYKEQDPEKVAEFEKTIAGIPADKIAYVDETGIDTYIHRPYCRMKRGVKVTGSVSGKKYKCTSIVSALIGNKQIEPLQYSDSMDSVLFEEWFETKLLPHLPQNTTIVMDNASFHRKSRFIPLAESAGHTLLFLPPYSPELNPIEKFWYWLKARLKKVLHFFDDLDLAISDCFHVR